LLAFNPRATFEERIGRQRLREVMLLNRMARQCERLQPGQAAELRELAGRS
jgi:hypothetical protein